MVYINDLWQAYKTDSYIKDTQASPPDEIRDWKHGLSHTVNNRDRADLSAIIHAVNLPHIS